jgi:drug/metabolite transporter (DMT)-like permease
VNDTRHEPRLIVRDPDHSKSVFLLLLAALLWSSGGLLFKYVTWPALAIGGARGAIAAIFLVVVSGRSLRFIWSPVQIGAALSYAACTVLFAMANKLTTAANAILLQYTAPVWIALFGTWLLGERSTRADWATIAAVFLGMGIFLYDGLQVHDIAGILVAIASGFFFALTAIFLRKQKTGSPLESIILGNLISFLIGLPAIWSAPPLSSTGMNALVALGVVQLGLAYFLYARAIKHVTALEAVIIPIIEPILNPVWVMIFAGEHPNRLALVGGVIVLGSVTWRAIASIRSRRLGFEPSPTGRAS